MWDLWQKNKNQAQSGKTRISLPINLFISVMFVTIYTGMKYRVGFHGGRK